MRIFIAIPISKRLQEQVLNYQKFYSDLPVRWLEGKNLHITLIPPWEEENIAEIEKKLRLLENKLGEFEMEFNSVSFGPNKRNPRLIWVIGKAPGKIIELKKILEGVLNKPSERNNFLLHLTIARFRPEDFHNFPIKNINDKVNWKDTAKKFVIMRSHLSRKGADYEILKRYKL